MTDPALCATVTAATMEELRARRDAVKGADLVELRLDGIRTPDVAGALKDRQLPVIVTCRAGWEGGQFKGSEEERRLARGRIGSLGSGGRVGRGQLAQSRVIACNLRRSPPSSADLRGSPAISVDLRRSPTISDDL